MEYFKLKKQDGNIVSCVKEIPSNPEGIVIVIHGFTSSKESATYRMLLERLPKAGFGAICIDLPGHGTEESAKETLRIPGALDSIEEAEKYAVREYPGCKIFYFASSFGAYLTGLYISTREHAGRKAFWRSGAVNMPELFHKENMTEAEKQQMKDLETKGYFYSDMDLHRPVKVTMDFYNDLMQNDLFEIFDASRFGEHQIAMAHGREDTVIDPKMAEKFAEKFRIPVTWFPGEGHSLSNSSATPLKVADLAVDLYRGEKSEPEAEIKNVVIVGMGALGLLFGQRIARNLGRERLCYLMDAERRERHASDRYTINGKEISFRMKTPEEIMQPADLVIVATKYSGLFEARKQMAPAVGPDTIIVSLLNGISSEEILAEAFPRSQILDCIAIGMDAVREGTSLTYQNIGKWQIGSSQPGQEKQLAMLEDFLKRAGIPFEVCPDIQRAMWNKFMLNVGINQTCMVYETTYGGATAEGSEAFSDMTGAMHEVIRISEAEGIGLTEEDLEKDVALLRSLDPELYPSMRQDALAKRPSEVELFAGTVIRISRKHGIEAPVNERYYRVVKETEGRY